MTETDSTILAERCGQLQTENAQLKEKLAIAERRIDKEDILRTVNRLAETVQTWVVVAALAVVLVYPLYKLVTASGVPTHCHVRMEGTHPVGGEPGWNLVAFIEWSQDKYIGTFPSLDAALEGAKKIGCQVK